MEVKGENFIKNLEIEIEKKKLKEQTDMLNEQKEQTVLFPTSPMSYENEDSSIDELDDIVLNEETTNNKQKYIVLAFALILVFLITIIIIRLLSQPSKQNEFTQDISVDQELQVTNNENNKKENNSKEIVEKNLNINTIDKIEEKITKDIPKDEIPTQNIKSDIFEIKKEIPKDIIKKEKIVDIEEIKTKEKDIKKETKKKIINKKDLFKQISHKKDTSTKIQGYFIQIGAFTKNPNQYLMKTLEKNNFKYAFYKIKIKNKKFTKFLVGPFTSHKKARQKLNKVKKITNNNGAYIIRFK